MDRKTLIPGCILITALTVFLIGYQIYEDSKEVIPQTQTEEQAREATIDGYEEPEELIEYMLFQIQKGDLDLALRGCAIQKVAENFQLQSYIEYTGTYEPLEILPPPDTGSNAYMEISQFRMSAYYAEWMEKCISALGPEHEVKLLSIQEDVPENPDGKYYTRRTSICEIIGAQKIREMLICMEVDGEVQEYCWTVTRYGSRWQVLLFTSLDNYGSGLLDIRSSSAEYEDGDAIDYECEDILPVNYVVLNANSGSDPEEVIKRFLLYLQREDVWSALSYVELYDMDQVLHTETEFLENHAHFAEQIQKFYYGMFFQDQDVYEWYFRDLSNRAGDLVEDLHSGRIITMNVRNSELMNTVSENIREYRVTYEYGYQWFTCILVLEKQNGWRIKSIEM